MLIGSFTLLKSYPTLGDYALWHALLACFSELLPCESISFAHSSKRKLIVSLVVDVSSPLFHTLLPLYALLLLPTFHHLWLYSGSGNANFFYASTLVWAISQGGWALEFMQAKGKREVGLGLSKEGREKVRQGKWSIVQR